MYIVTIFHYITKKKHTFYYDFGQISSFNVINVLLPNLLLKFLLHAKIHKILLLTCNQYRRSHIFNVNIIFPILFQY